MDMPGGAAAPKAPGVRAVSAGSNGANAWRADPSADAGAVAGRKSAGISQQPQMIGQSQKPAMIGPWRLLRTIGEGEFGKVKLAVHQDSQAEVAIKLCKKTQIVAVPNGYTKLMREISTLKKVKSHPYIISLIDVIETDSSIAIVMDLARGGELFELILDSRAIQEGPARRMFAQIICAVGYIHSIEIVHRDLKLENILLDEHGNVVIIDFGFANKSKGPNGLLQTSCGSPCYAAPELVTQDGYNGEKADIWSCGVILFSMLAGYLPFDDDPANPDGENINLLYNYIMETKLVFPDYVTPLACDLVNRILVPDPKYRADMEEIMAHEWFKPVRWMFVEEMGRRRAQGIPIPASFAHLSRSPTPPPLETPQTPMEIEPVPQSSLIAGFAREETDSSLTKKIEVPVTSSSAATGTGLFAPSSPISVPFSIPVPDYIPMDDLEMNVNNREVSIQDSDSAMNLEDTDDDVKKVDDLRGMLTLLCNDNKSLPSIPSASTENIKQKIAEQNGVFKKGGNDPKRQQGQSSNLAMFLQNWRKSNSPLPPHVGGAGATENGIGEPKGILRGIIQPVSVSSSRVSSGKKQVSIVEPSLTVEGTREGDVSRNSWFGGVTLWKAKAESEGNVKVEGNSSPVVNRSSIISPFRNNSTAERIVSSPIPTLENGYVQEFYKVLPPVDSGQNSIPDVGQPAQTSTIGAPKTVITSSNPIASSRPISNGFTNVFTQLRSTSLESRSSSENNNNNNNNRFFRSRSRTPSSWYGRSRSRARTPSNGPNGTTPDVTNDVAQLAANTNVNRWSYLSGHWSRDASVGPLPTSTIMSRSGTVMSLSTSDYHIQFTSGRNNVNTAEQGDALAVGSSSTLRAARAKALRASKMRRHVGNVDSRAISRRDPESLLADLEAMLVQRGFDVFATAQDSNEFRLKVVRPGFLARVGSSAGGNVLGTAVPLATLSRFIPIPAELVAESVVTQSVPDTKTTDVVGLSGKADNFAFPVLFLPPDVARSIAKTLKGDSGIFGIKRISSSVAKKMQYLKNYGMNYNTGFDSRGSLMPPVPSSSPVPTTVTAAAVPQKAAAEEAEGITATEMNTAEPGGGSGGAVGGSKVLQFVDEIVFYVELQKVSNMPGVCLVDFKRVRGEIWSFKKLYNDLVLELPVL
ncbi:hypothetical protein HDU84_001615 [Entophlyctis sp. JEL0112]|nr:hypothetical protein HDU84_001615 [Entophlyctis sp. JEL0112]